MSSARPAYSDAVAPAKNRKPGLILADIQFADGLSGLDAVNELPRTFEVSVVFAYPERFLAVNASMVR